ncbi:hypothetical protein FI667_g9458, partial [Globisporangium splendens]
MTLFDARRPVREHCRGRRQAAEKARIGAIAAQLEARGAGADATGQLMKWKGLMDQDDDFLEQSTTILRDHMLEDDEVEGEAGSIPMLT